MFKNNVMILTAISLFLFGGCKDKSVNPIIENNNILFYVAPGSEGWDIFKYDFNTGASQVIINHSWDDEYPQCSPDGRYLLFARSKTGHLSYTIIYDLKTQSELNLSPDGGTGSNPIWSPTNKVCLGYPYAYTLRHETYLMNVDGSDQKMILDATATSSLSGIYFYPDGTTFLSIHNYQIVQKCNIDRTRNDFVLDLKQVFTQNSAIQGFNPYADQLYISTTRNDGRSIIVNYSVTTRDTSVLFVEDENYSIFQIRLSNDFSTIAMIEHSDQDEYLSILKDGIRRRLIRSPSASPGVYFSYKPMQFSPDGKYLAFSKQVFGSGSWVSFTEVLQVIDVETGTVIEIGKGHSPVWNSKP